MKFPLPRQRPGSGSPDLMVEIDIRLSEVAVTDLEALGKWYAELGVPEVGDRFLREIVARIETLREHPELGRVVPEFGQPSLRELIHPPFRIVYRCEATQVRIVRVWRSEGRLALPEDGPS